MRALLTAELDCLLQQSFNTCVLLNTVEDSRSECLTLPPGESEITTVPGGCVTEATVTVNVSVVRWHKAER